MIALRDDLPLIQLHNGIAVAFERGWLVRALEQAASKAGYDQWWLSEHVAESVTHYLRDQREWTVIPVDQLGRAVQAAVEVIGYPEVARHFQPLRACLRISLLEIAREAGHGYELAFFEALGRRIFQVVREQRCDFVLEGLDLCVKVLRGQSLWSRQCEPLRDEIVSFVRVQTALASGENDATFAIC